MFDLADPAAGTPFSTTMSGLAPGDFGDRLLTLHNGGSIGFASVALAASAPTTSLLDSDVANGLTLQVDACSVPWSQASVGVAATCSGTTTALTPATALATLKSGGSTWSTGLSSLTGGGTDYLRFHYALPTASTGTAGLSTTLSFAFTATQAVTNTYR